MSFNQIFLDLFASVILWYALCLLTSGVCLSYNRRNVIESHACTSNNIKVCVRTENIVVFCEVCTFGVFSLLF